ncbi:MAG: hypothetical protein IT204_12560 [Fimbriimonadaceae bacterium]|nr:hypothetical protein [Fimbriimonadaceae bacterium]
MRTPERWIWTELIGFDATGADAGVGEYLAAAGFTPDAVCLLLTSPDFVLSHVDRAEEFALAPDYCSRDGHEFGRQRQRQVWTNRGLQQLVRELQARGVQVYLTVFTAHYRDQFHHEWISDHLEVRAVYADCGPAHCLCALARLADGSYFEDYWVAQLRRVLDYYGFDGWHGADGWGPLGGPLWRVSLSDDLLGQFRDWLLARGDAAVEPELQAVCGDVQPAVAARGRWLWQHRRSDWIAFWSDRWTQFWQKVLTALHSDGKRAVINSSWGRAPVESLYRYGVDYRRIAAAGVDGIVVETAAAGLWLERECQRESLPFDFISGLLLIRADVPQTKLIFLHNVHDICEQWDALRHTPALLERDIDSLANQFLVTPDGPRPAADGLLVCLGDGLLPREWAWLRERWEQSFGPLPTAVDGVTLLWSDAAREAEPAAFTASRLPLAHRLLFELQTLGAPVHSAVRSEHLDAHAGPLLVLHGDLLPAAERAAVLARTAPLLVLGRDLRAWPPAALTIRDTMPVEPLECRVYGAQPPAPAALPATPSGDHWLADLLSIHDDWYYWTHLQQRLPSPSFLTAVASLLQHLAAGPRASTCGDDVTLLTQRQADGWQRLAIRSKRDWYVQPTIDYGAPIAELRVVTEFPLVRVRPQGSQFTVRIPPQGVVVVAVRVGRNA